VTFVPDQSQRRQEILARNEARFREQNESVKASNAAHAWVDPPVPDWSCECGWENCREPVRMSMAEYEAVRSVATHFLVAPDEGHVAREVEVVVERKPTYWVVEKLGHAAAIATDLDPRSSEPGG
jgi:hypothetical protein